MKPRMKYLAPLFFLSSLSTAFAACTPPQTGTYYIGAGGGTGYYNGGTPAASYPFYTSQTFEVSFTSDISTAAQGAAVGSFGGIIKTSISLPPNTVTNSAPNLNAPSQTIFFNLSSSPPPPIGTVTLVGYRGDLCTAQLQFDATPTTVSFSGRGGTVSSTSYTTTFANTYQATFSQGGSVMTLAPISLITPSSVPSQRDLFTAGFTIELRAQ
ncbi:hypothetical protein [Methylocystis echinoides]|uniref:hypothetical protein n=1 Tax=Methylocystis echinoides TaxID=29468 RepID=UPI002491D154|nr:hypothetical protein [Methylocystis echinoides]